MSETDQLTAPTAPVTKQPKPRRGFPAAIHVDRRLTKRELFVAEYLVDLNGAQAAIGAGYKPQNAVSQASRMSRKANVQAALQAAYKAREARTQVTADATIREIGRLAHSDIRRFYDAQRNLLPIHQLPDDLAACIASVEVVLRTLSGGAGVIETKSVYKIKLWNKPRALELLGRHQGIFTQDRPPAATVPAFALPPETPGVSVH